MQNKNRCVHFRAIHYNDSCEAGVNFNELMRVKELGRTGCMMRLPCTGRTGVTRGIPVEPCNKYQPLTEADIQKEIDMLKRAVKCLKDDVSSCCNAPIDKSRVIQRGKHKGHGPRYCSKCKSVVYVV
jgi:hypothetical protein